MIASQDRILALELANKDMAGKSCAPEEIIARATVYLAFLRGDADGRHATVYAKRTNIEVDPWSRSTAVAARTI